MADRDTRTEAAAGALFAFFGSRSGAGAPTFGHRLCGRRVLAAADADDRENGIVRVKLGQPFRAEFRRAVHEVLNGDHRGLDDCIAASDRLLSVLREAVQP